MSQEAIAYHEAGHSVAACLIPKRFKTVTIIPNEDSLGRLSQNPWKDFHSDYETDRLTTSRAKAYIFMILAGPVAESIFTGDGMKEGSHGDLEKVRDLAVQPCGSDEQIFAYVDFMWEQTKTIVNLNWVAVDAVAKALQERKTLKYLEARDIVKVARKGVIAHVDLL